MSLRVLLLAAAMGTWGCQHQNLQLEPPPGFDGNDMTTATGDMARAAGDMSLAAVAACNAGGNLIYFDGDADDYIHPGAETIHVDTWSQLDQETDAAHTFQYAWQEQQASGVWWDFTFSTKQLSATLAPGTYSDAQRFGFEGSGHPGLDVEGSGRGCDTITGSFTIYTATLNSAGDDWSALTASFEQHCEGVTAALRGCIHFQQ